MTDPSDPAVSRGYDAYRHATEALEDGEAAFREALAADPHNTTAQFSLAVVLFRSGKMDDAGQLLQDLVERQPHNADAAYYLGLVYRYLGQLPAAREQLETVLAINPKHASAAAAIADLDALGHDVSHAPVEPTPPEPAPVISAGSTFYTLLLNDGSEISRQSVALIDKIAMDRRARRSAYLSRYVLLFLWIFVPVAAFVAIMGKF